MSLKRRASCRRTDVHRELGPGLLESAYQHCLAYEFRKQSIDYKFESSLAVRYKGIQVDCGYRIDFLVQDKLIIELKSVDEVKKIHQAQLLTYMKLSSMKIGLLINFNSPKLKEGIKRFVL